MTNNSTATRKIILLSIMSLILTSTEARGDPFLFGELVSLDVINSPQRDYYPAISPNGLELYWVSNRPGGIYNPNDSAQTDIWYATRALADEPFGTPVLAPGDAIGFPAPINSLNWEEGPDISADGLTLYFASNPEDFPNRQDEIYCVTRASFQDPWGSPVLLDSGVNSEEWAELSPNISSDGLELYFARQKKPYNLISDFDIWRSTRSDTAAPWGTAVNLSINSPSDYDGSPSLSGDDLSLFFTSYRSGGLGNGDIWMSHRASKESEWGQPVNLGSPVNTAQFDGFADVAADGNTLYLTRGSSFSDSNSQIWQATRIFSALEGDYNGNGMVDAADYVVWRNSLGQSGANLPADGNRNNQIDSDDFEIWRSHFGQTAGSSAGAIANGAMPEPTSAWMLLMGLLAMCLCQRVADGSRVR